MMMWTRNEPTRIAGAAVQVFQHGEPMPSLVPRPSRQCIFLDSLADGIRRFSTRLSFTDWMQGTEAQRGEHNA